MPNFYFKSIVAKDPDIHRVQANIDNLVAQLNKSITSGNIVTVNILTTDTKVNHGLSRPVIGWFVIGKNGSADIWESTSVNNVPNLYIILKTNAPISAKIYFF